VKLVIDATPLLVRSAGVKNYLYYWIQHLRRIGGAEIRTLPQFAELPALTHEHSIAGFWRTTGGLAALALANYTAVPVVQWATRDAAVFHATHLLRNPSRGGRLTATVHDVTSWLLPEFHPAANRRADENFRATLKRADGVIAVSESTKNDVVRVLGLAAEKITVIHSGIASGFFEVTRAEMEAVRERYRLGRPFVLFAGTIEPRKNVDALVEAYGQLAPSLREEFELVMVGPIGWAKPATVARVRQARYLGYIPEADMAPLTAAAAVFAYPSLYEGFGFPVAQAMAAGVPVVTANVSSLPEIAGDAALLIDPRSTGELRDALTRILLSPALRAELAERGRRRAAAFTWENCAAASWRFFERVAGS
jgi:alpha-1,3-rhamnosyl/mannosyltransferase